MNAADHNEHVYELAHRQNDGIEVSLLWNKRSDRLTVAIVDTKRGDAFELPVGSANAMDVFHHPYAYAAFRGVEVGAASEPREPVYA